MYYNITIKVLDSQYGLESENKDIIEREMDAYFAYFFDASYEFKSKIKKVELTSDSLVSIEDINNPESFNKKEEEEEEIQYYESSDDFYDEPFAEELSNVSIEETTPSQEEVKEEIIEESQEKIEEFIEPQQETIEEAIVELNQEADSLKTIEEVVFSEESSVEDETIIEQNETIVEQEQNIEYNETSNIEQTEEIIEEVLFKNETIEELNAPQEETFVLENVNEDDSKFVADIIEEPQMIQESIEQVVNEPIIEAEPIQKPLEQAKPKEVKLDFKFFLAGFIISDIFNQFMACAYYIKNVLKQNCFNMKTINSHLIKATGNIADMSVVFELMQKEYIDSKEINDSTVYYITPLGEEYFIKKYQE